jgi:hypothetical protein
MFARRLALTFAATAVVAGSVIVCGTAANADVPSASPSTVAALLGASKVPAALVVLVDISDSMSASEGGLYPEVQTELPAFLGALAKQDPQDQVAVVVFGNRNDTRTIYPMGPPTASIPLPGNANSLGTDIGYAFQLALANLAQAPKNIQVGGVLLLSDGGMWAPNDPTYDGGRGYRAPGWATLRKQVQGFSIPVTGYGLPLTKNTGDIDALQQALTACFGSQQQMLSPNFSDLTGQLDGTQEKILDTRVAAAAGPDSGQGVKVSWKGPAASGGALQLNLPSGQANVSVTLTAGTQRIPLHVNDLSVRATGLPANVTTRISSSDIALAPGHSVTLPVELSWPSVTGDSAAAAGGQRSWPVKLTLSGHVYSPFTNAIKKYYLDKSFTTGQLTGNASANFVAIIPSSLGFFQWVLIFLLLVALIGGACFIAVRRARLHGALAISTVGDVSGQLTLPPRPWFSGRIDNAIGIPGIIHVRGNPLDRRMRIKLRNSRLPDGENTLEPGGRTMISGLMVTHEDQVPGPADSGSGSGSGSSTARYGPWRR